MNRKNLVLKLVQSDLKMLFSSAFSLFPTHCLTCKLKLFKVLATLEVSVCMLGKDNCCTPEKNTKIVNFLFWAVQCLTAFWMQMNIYTAHIF